MHRWTVCPCLDLAESLNSRVFLWTLRSLSTPGRGRAAASGRCRPGRRRERAARTRRGRWGRCSVWRAPAGGSRSVCDGRTAPPPPPPAPGSGTRSSPGPRRRPHSSSLWLRTQRAESAEAFGPVQLRSNIYISTQEIHKWTQALFNEDSS